MPADIVMQHATKRWGPEHTHTYMHAFHQQPDHCVGVSVDAGAVCKASALNARAAHG